MNQWHYFSDEEVSKWQLDPQLWSMLDMARDKAGVPFIITSGRRTIEQEIALKGGVRDSAHIKGLGVDIATGDDHTFERVEYGLCLAGFKRRGKYIVVKPGDSSSFVPHHIHVDIDPDLPQEVSWIKLEQNG